MRFIDFTDEFCGNRTCSVALRTMYSCYGESKSEELYRKTI